MKNQSTVPWLLLQILSGDPVEAIEAAKQALRHKGDDDFELLLRTIAGTKIYRKWSRVAAIYILGFSARKASTCLTLRSILADRSEAVRIREHAAEALGNRVDRHAVPLLARILAGKESTSLKRWCIYALSEINTPRAKGMLAKFQKLYPTGLIGRQLREVLGSTPLQRSRKLVARPKNKSSTFKAD